MKINILFIIIFPLFLTAFEPIPVTPNPVVGYQTVPFSDDFHQIYRHMLIWYPVSPLTPGKASSSPWDVFELAQNATIETHNRKLPVIMLSHGYTGNPHQLSWLIQGLVNHGFIVVSIQHLDKIDDKPHMNHWLRAKDIHLLIDQFTNHPLAASADLSHIGIAGYSLGGTTAIWIAGGRSNILDKIIPGPEYASPKDYTMADEAMRTFDKRMMASDWRDKRVKAAFVMAPAWAWLFDESGLRSVTIPTYLIAASEDKILVTRNNAGYFARFIPKSIFQEIKGKADHYIFISMLNGEQRKKADPTGELSFLFEDNVSVNRQWIQSQVVREAVNFFNSVFVISISSL